MFESPFPTILTLFLLFVSFPERAMACVPPAMGASDAVFDAYYACLDGDGGSDGSGGDDVIVPDSSIAPPVLSEPEPVPISWPKDSFMANIRFSDSVSLSRDQELEFGNLMNGGGGFLGIKKLVESLNNGPTLNGEVPNNESQNEFLTKEAEFRKTILLLDRLMSEDVFDFRAQLSDFFAGVPDSSLNTSRQEQLFRPVLGVYLAIYDCLVLYPDDSGTYELFLKIHEAFMEASKNAGLSHDQKETFQSLLGQYRFALYSSRGLSKAQNAGDMELSTGGNKLSANYRSRYLFGDLADARKEALSGKSDGPLSAWGEVQPSLLETTRPESDPQTDNVSVGANGKMLDILYALLDESSSGTVWPDAPDGFSLVPDSGVLRLATPFKNDFNSGGGLSSDQLSKMVAAFLKAASFTPANADSGTDPGTLARTVKAAATAPLILEVQSEVSSDPDGESRFFLVDFDDNGLGRFSSIGTKQEVVDSANQAEIEGPLNFAKLTFSEGDQAGVFVLDPNESVTEVATSWAQWLGGNSPLELTRQPPIFNSAASPSDRTRALLSEGSRSSFVPLLPLESYLVTTVVPKGFSILQDGTILGVEGRIGARLVVPPLDLAQAESMFAAMGELKFYPKPALLKVEASGQTLLAAAPSLAGVRIAEDVGATGWSLPELGDESALTYVLQLRYAENLVEQWQPAVEAGDFAASVSAMPGLSVSFDRAIGVVNVSGMRFRPAYTVSALTAPEETYRKKLADDFGLTYRLYDANNDGLEDVIIYSNSGKQLLYRVAAQ